MAYTDDAFIWPDVCEPCPSGGPSISQTSCSCPPLGPPHALAPLPGPPRPGPAGSALGETSLSKVVPVLICVRADRWFRRSLCTWTHYVIE